jgi:hypothetical protein
MEASYYAGWVYVFGGNNGFPLSDCEKYCVADNTWTNVSSLPSASWHNCSVVMENSIFVTGQQLSYVCRYNPDQNTFTSHGNFTRESYKLICTANNKLYVFDMKRIYESKDNEMNCFEDIGPFQKYYWGISYKIRNGNRIYFLLVDGSILKFDIISRSMSVFRKVYFS